MLTPLTQRVGLTPSLLASSPKSLLPDGHPSPESLSPAHRSSSSLVDTIITGRFEFDMKGEPVCSLLFLRIPVLRGWLHWDVRFRITADESPKILSPDVGGLGPVQGSVWELRSVGRANITQPPRWPACKYTMDAKKHQVDPNLLSELGLFFPVGRSDMRLQPLEQWQGSSPYQRGPGNV